MTKLLNKPLKAFTLYALFILACSIPVYYLVVDFIWLKELDEHNEILKERIEKRLDDMDIVEDELNSLMKNWGTLQPGSSLIPIALSSKGNDKIYTITKLSDDRKHPEMDRFRGLRTYIEINDKYYQLQIETNVEESAETILAIAIVTLFFFVLLVVGFMILNMRISRKIWRPFSYTLGKLKAFDLTKQESISFEQTDIREFNELNQSLQKLINNNISAYRQQKTFIENASHEFQTPLAVLRSKLNMLFQSTTLTKEQSEILAAIELPIARMSRINKNLLLLAKIDNSQFAETDAMNVNTIVAETLELLADYIDTKKINIQYQPLQEIKVVCNKSLLEMLINNLLINAIIHSKENAVVHISLVEGTLAVSNAGDLALNKDGMFQRFSILSAKNTNSGLGLAIVKEICGRYGWHIGYKFESGFHKFSIKF